MKTTPITRPDDDVFPNEDYVGLTIREYMATHIMAGFGPKPDYGNPSLAELAVHRADELIEELNKPRKGKT